MDRDWENYIDASTILWEKNDYRLIECAMLCGRDPSCISFFHHPSLKTCMGSPSYKRGLPANPTTQQGWKYYTRCFIPQFVTGTDIRLPETILYIMSNEPQHCVEDYVYNQTLGICYKLYELKMAYTRAMDLCERDRAKLLIINSTAELHHFARMFGALQWAWVGLRDKSNTSSVFQWWNGKVASNISWYSGYPKHGYDSGVHLLNGTYVKQTLQYSSIEYSVSEAYLIIS